MIVRNDDVNASTDLSELRKLYDTIWKRSPKATIISCVTIFSKHNSVGSVYQEVPFKNRPKPWFYNVNQVWDTFLGYGKRHKVASHGLLHLNHANLSADAQELSIVTSCQMLNTRIFVAPFNAYNEDTIKICAEFGIELLQDKHSWQSMEHNKFSSHQPYWYMHSWRWKVKSLKEYLWNG